MRLTRLGTSRRRRLLALAQRWWRTYVTRRAGHDLATVFFLRPRCFGEPFMRYAMTALRGPSDWTVAERELLATVVAQANQCPFCAVEHEVQARHGMDRELVDAVMAGRPHPAIGPRLRAALDFAVRLAQSRGAVDPAEGAALRTAGLTSDDIADVVHVTAALCTVSRVAESLGFTARLDLLRRPVGTGAEQRDLEPAVQLP